MCEVLANNSSDDEPNGPYDVPDYGPSALHEPEDEDGRRRVDGTTSGISEGWTSGVTSGIADI